MNKEDKNLKKEEEIKVGQTVWTTGTEGLQEQKIKSIGTRYIYLENDNRKFNKSTLEVSGSEKELSNIVLDKKKYEIEQLKENIIKKKESVKKLFEGVEKISKKIIPKEGHTTNVDLLFSSLKQKINKEGISVLELKKGAVKKELRENSPIRKWKGNLISEIVKVDPKLKDLESYKNYEKNKSQENASKFLEKSYEVVGSDNRVKDIYLKNIANKPSNAQIVINSNDSSVDKIKSLSQQYISHKIDMELESKVITNLLLKKYDLDKYGFDIKGTIDNISNLNNVSTEERLNKIEKTYNHIEKIVPIEKEIRNKAKQDINVGDIVRIGVLAYGTEKAIEELAIVTKKLGENKLEVNKLKDNKKDITTHEIKGYSKELYVDLSKSYSVDINNISGKVGELKKDDMEVVSSRKELFKEQKLSDPSPRDLENEKSQKVSKSNVVDLATGLEMMQS